MRVLDVNNSYSPSGGGVRIYEHRKMEHFRSIPGHSFALAAPSAGSVREHRNGTVIYGCDSLPLLDSGYRMTFRSGPILSAINDFHPDIVEIGSPWIMPALVRRVIGRHGIPTVGFYHTDYPESHIRPLVEGRFPPGVARVVNAIAERSVPRAYSAMDGVFCASRSVLSRLYDYGLRKLFHTPLGVDTDLFRPSKRSAALRESLGAWGERKLVLYMARLQEEKGIDLLMKAYPMFRDTSSTVLVIGGRGPAEKRVREFAGEYPEVRLLGYLQSREDAAAILASADVYLALGQYETFGLAALEAISSGTLTVLSSTGAGADMARMAEVLPTFEKGSAESLAEKTKALLKLDRESASNELRSAVLSGMDWESVFRREEKFYRMILDATRKGDSEALLPPGRWWEA